MCHIWKYPSDPAKELTVEELSRLPSGFLRINLGGGEPTLRKDLAEIVDVLYPKTKHLEISTNGYLTNQLIAVGRKYPETGVRVSIEGLPQLNDEIRGMKNGFDHALRTVLRLKDLGMKNVGFSFTISHRNIRELVDVYHLASLLGVELTQCIVHDAWQFRIQNNIIEDREMVIAEIKKFIGELLLSKRSNLYLRFKDWYRAYINRGFINFVRGDKRLLPCGAGTNIFFIDPYGEVYPCNALNESMGNVRENSLEELWSGSKAQKVREMVASCPQNCWMTGTVRPAIRKNLWNPTFWVMKNKFRILLGKEIDWCSY
jgi:MoaA/NifB/PqqE/SkfB family radical SAM enzyme